MPHATDIPHPLISAALARPEHPALVFEGRRWTARALCDQAGALAGALSLEGVAAKQRVGLIGPPDARFVVGLHALSWLGAVVVPLSSSGTPDELEASLKVSAARRVLVTGALTQVQRRALESCAAVLEVEPLQAREAPSAPERFWPMDEARLVVMTSGTSGVPKPVVLTTAQLLTSAFGSAIRLGHLPSDRWLSCLPLHHVGGLSILFRCAFYATTVVLHSRFDAQAVASTLDDGGASLVSLVPRMLTRVLDVRQAQGRAAFPESLRCVLLGGAAAPPALLARCEAIGAPVSVTWGMSEAASQVCTRPAGEFAPDGGVGAPLAFARVTSQGGRLKVTGPVVVGGGCVTGDAGAVDVRGRVHVEGRADDVIISGGENISPAEVESALRAHESIAEAAVVGVPDAAWGQRPVAALVASGAARPELALLRAWCRERLAPFKAPDKVLWVTRLPRGQLGKLSRARVRALFEAGGNPGQINPEGDRPQEDAG